MLIGETQMQIKQPARTGCSAFKKINIMDADTFLIDFCIVVAGFIGGILTTILIFHAVFKEKNQNKY